MLFQWNVWPVFFPSSDSKDVLLPPQPCSITIVGNGPSPLAGSVTSASSGTPSKVATRLAAPSPGQKRTPFIAAQSSPSGLGVAAVAEAGSAIAAAAIAIARTPLPFTGGTLTGWGGPRAGRYLTVNSTFASTPTFVWLLLAR